MDSNFICPFFKSENIKLMSVCDFKGYDILVPDMKEKERKMDRLSRL